MKGKGKIAGKWMALMLAFVLVLTACMGGSGTETKETGKASTPPKESGIKDDGKKDPPAPTDGKMKPGWYNLADFEQKAGKKLETYKQSPFLDEKVKSGALEPVEQRLPKNPLVMQTWGDIGEYGGTLQYFDTNPSTDIYLRHINTFNMISRDPGPYDSFSGLDGPNSPGVFESWEKSADGTVFIFKIREGLKWSDGEPVTTDDVSFMINDVLLNKDLNPTRPDWLRWGGGETKFEVIDTYSFKFTFAKPYGSFIETFVRDWPGSWIKLILPKHYLSKFHKKYAEQASLLAEMKKASISKIERWPQFFSAKMGIYTSVDYIGQPNAEPYPTLNPYIAVKDLKNQNWLLERNPYFGVVDAAGNQLPYIDRLQRSFASTKETLNLNIISGKSDLQAMAISLEDYPLFHENTAKGHFKLMNLKAWQDQMEVYFFNMATKDAEVAKIYSDVRFRQAMSLALNRQEINESLFMGTGRPAQAAPRPGSPFFEESMEKSFAEYDPEKAKKLLDEMGLVDKNGDGWRDRLDGKSFSIRFDYFLVSGASDSGAQLAKKYWDAVGVKTDVKSIDGGYWFTLKDTNEMEATGWWLGGSGANLIQPWFFNFGLNVPQWAGWWTAKDADKSKWKEPPQWAKDLLKARDDLFAAASDEERIAIGKKIWQIQAENLVIIGTVTESRTPVIFSEDLGNVEQAKDLDLTSVGLLDNSYQFYFKNPDRRK